MCSVFYRMRQIHKRPEAVTVYYGHLIAVYNEEDERADKLSKAEFK